MGGGGFILMEQGYKMLVTKTRKKRVETKATQYKLHDNNCQWPSLSQIYIFLKEVETTSYGSKWFQIVNNKQKNTT